MPADVSSALLDLARLFTSLGVRWYVFGAQAVIAAGVPRLTADVDVTVEIPKSAVPVLLAALGRHGFALRDVDDVMTFITETRVVPAAHIGSGIPIDLVLAGPGLEEEMLARVVMREVRGASIPFVATADLIALKVLAGREKDLEDVRALIRAAPPDLSLDEARARVAHLAQLLEDPTLVASLESATTPPKRRGRPKK